MAPFTLGRHELVARDGSQTLRCELVALESLGCAFERLTLFSPALAGASMDRLKKISESLSAKLTYLLEPIAPIEIDSDRCTVQMRSNPPQKDADQTSYYELLVSRAGSSAGPSGGTIANEGEISLCRYSVEPGQPRHIVPTHVTREVLLRLVGDLSTAL